MAILKVVGEEQLEQSTTAGWKLEDTREVETVMNVAGNDIVMVPQPGGYSSPQTVYVNGQKVVRGLRFILSKNDESVLAAQAEELAKLKETLQVLGNEKVEWVAAKKAWEMKEEKWSKSKEALEAESKTLRVDFIRARDKVETYELDMGKLRQEYGASEMRRVTGR